MRSAVALLLVAGPAQAQGWSDVAALFNERCVVCHSGEFAPLGLRLDSYESAVEGSEDGPVIVAGDPSGSRLLDRLLGVIEPRMPLDGPPFLEPGEIAKVEAWIVAGLPRGGRRMRQKFRRRTSRLRPMARSGFRMSRAF